MNFITKHIGSSGNRPASKIELTVRSQNIFFTSKITELKTNKVPEDFIMELRDLADELQYHNDKVDNQTRNEE